MMIQINIGHGWRNLIPITSASEAEGRKQGAKLAAYVDAHCRLRVLNDDGSVKARTVGGQSLWVELEPDGPHVDGVPVTPIDLCSAEVFCGQVAAVVSDPHEAAQRQDILWHQVSLGRQVAKLKSVWDGVARALHEELGQECSGEPFDDLRAALAELRAFRSVRGAREARLDGALTGEARAVRIHAASCAGNMPLAECNCQTATRAIFFPSC